MGERELWNFFNEVREAVGDGNRGEKSHPYRSGTFMITALAGDVELSVKDISEEDAVLIAGELRERGVRAVVSASVICPNCSRRVPQQDYCVSCRARLSHET